MGLKFPIQVLRYGCSQYPMPWRVKFDWRYGIDSSEVIWQCIIELGSHIYSIGNGLSQIEALKEAVDKFPKKGKVTPLRITPTADSTANNTLDMKKVKETVDAAPLDFPSTIKAGGVYLKPTGSHKTDPFIFTKEE